MSKRSRIRQTRWVTIDVLRGVSVVLVIVNLPAALASVTSGRTMPILTTGTFTVVLLVTIAVLHALEVRRIRRDPLP